MKLFNHKKSDSSARRSALGTIFHRIGRDPHTDWVVIFGVAMIAALGLVSLGFLTLLDVRARLSGDSKATPAAGSITFDAKSLSNVLGQFDIRAVERGNLERRYDGPRDPSI